MVSPRLLNPQVQRPITRVNDRPVRSPQTPFSTISLPWELTPFCLFPVLPGETMTNCLIQAQVWSDPIKSAYKSSPWTHEMWMFYVKFRDLPGYEASADGLGRDLIQMIETDESQAANRAGAYVAMSNCPKAGIDYVLEATKRITECYFREDGQAWNIATSANGYPLAHAFPGRRKDANWKLNVGAGAAPVAEDRRVAMPAFVGGAEFLADLDYAANRNQTTAAQQAMDYEDIVRAAGGRAVVRDVDRDDLHVPELLGYVRHFDYPTNTVEPTTGTPAVAWGHRLKQAMRQNFRFPEFGWVIGLQVFRPKAFYARQEGLYACMMQQRAHWFMPNQDGDADSHWLLMLDNEGPLNAIMDTPNNQYVIDIRDLLWYGEQFCSTSLVGATPREPVVTGPNATGTRDYPTSPSDLDLPFVTAGGVFRMNGVIDVSIKSFPAVNPNLTQDDRDYSNRD